MTRIPIIAALGFGTLAQAGVDWHGAELHAGPVSCLAVLDEGRPLASANAAVADAGAVPFTLKIWRPPKTKPRSAYPLANACSMMATGAGSSRLAVALSTGEVILTTAGGDVPPRRLSLTDDSYVTRLELSPDGRHLLAGDVYGRITHLDLGQETSRRLPAGNPPPGPLKDIGFVPGGSRFVVVGNRIIATWDLERSAMEGAFAMDAYADVAALSPDARRVAAAGNKGPVALIEVATQRTIHRLPGPAFRIGALAWSGDGTRLAVAYYDRIIRIWDTTRAIAVTEIAHHSIATSLVFDATGHVLTGGDESGHVWRWTLP